MTRNGRKPSYDAPGRRRRRFRSAGALWRCWRSPPRPSHSPSSRSCRRASRSSSAERIAASPSEPGPTIFCAASDRPAVRHAARSVRTWAGRPAAPAANRPLVAHRLPRAVGRWQRRPAPPPYQRAGLAGPRLVSPHHRAGPFDVTLLFPTRRGRAIHPAGDAPPAPAADSAATPSRVIGVGAGMAAPAPRSRPQPHHAGPGGEPCSPSVKRRRRLLRFRGSAATAHDDDRSQVFSPLLRGASALRRAQMADRHRCPAGRGSRLEPSPPMPELADKLGSWMAYG